MRCEATGCSVGLRCRWSLCARVQVSRPGSPPALLPIAHPSPCRAPGWRGPVLARERPLGEGVAPRGAASHSLPVAHEEARVANIHPSRAMRAVRLAILISFVLCVTAPGRAQSLRGSPASLTRQYEQAKRHDYTFLRQPADVQRFVDLGLLVPVRPGPAYDLARVSFPYARPEVKLFLERLGRQYQAACGEKLVVTSLVRPTTRQPRNAADRSVHPTGMAMDLRRSNKASCRRWLERVLLQLEARGVLEATRENRPPHYHVALFPRPYVQYVAALTGESVQGLLASVTEPRDANAAGAVAAAAEAETAKAET